MLSLLAFIAAAAVIVLLPGPDTLVVLRSLMRGGRSGALQTSLGICASQCVWVAATVLGLTALIRASHDGYLTLRIVGAAYLVVLGVQALRARGQGGLSDSSTGVRALLGAGFRAGLITDLLNPKVGVFFVTFLPAFVPSGQPATPWLLLFGGIFIAETALFLVVLVGFGERVLAWLRSPLIHRRLDRATGVVLIGFGARLVLEP